MEVVLKTTALTKKFGSKVAVNKVDMTIRKGEIYGFIGKNGAGKTTFMRVVLGMAGKDAGEISLFDGEEMEKSRHRTGSLIEQPGLYKNCTAVENMKRFGILSGADDREIPELLKLVGLGDAMNKKAGSFSLGMRQRLGIAIALLGHPDFLVLDEPVNGLDPAGMKEVRDLILKLNKEHGITILISSHLLDELAKIVTRYGIINDGSLVEDVSAEELRKRCTRHLLIRVDNPEKAKELISAMVPAEDIHIEGDALTITSHLEDAAKLNQLLCKNDLMVSTLEQSAEGMEDYFVERIGG